MRKPESCAGLLEARQAAHDTTRRGHSERAPAPALRLKTLGRACGVLQGRQVSRAIVADSLFFLEALEAVGPAEPAALHRHAVEPVADAADMTGPGDVRADLNSFGLESSHELAHRGLILRRVADQGLELLLLRDQASIPCHLVLGSRGRPLVEAGALAPYKPKAEVPLERSTRLLVAEVLAVLLGDHGPIGPDTVEQDVAMLVVLVVVPNDHVLDPVGVMASALEVLVREPGHLVVRQRLVGPSQAQRHMLDGLADVGPLLPDGFELPRQLGTRATGHVAADDLGLVYAIEPVPFVEGVARGASEASASGDLAITIRLLPA